MKIVKPSVSEQIKKYMFGLDELVRQLTFQFKKKFSTELPATIENPVLANGIQNVENRLRGAIQFLRRTYITVSGKKTNLNGLPWYLLIGSRGAGKTTLLANANIKYILDKKNIRENVRLIPNSETCDWWVTPNAVVVDVPGHYIGYKPKALSIANKLWRHFLLMTKELKGDLHGVVIAVSLSELVDKDNAQYLVESLRYRITELRAKFGSQLPFYFLVTKCDLLPGFLEFFSDYCSEELAQAWGVTMPLLQASESLTDVFNYRFNLLIKRLNKQLIWRLHQERNMHAKSAIKDFPLHVEQLRAAMASLLHKLFRVEDCFYLKGVYLTSALQQTEKTTPESEPIVFANQYPQALAILEAPAMPPQSFFVKQFILQALRA